jgi:ATP-dependent DNA helicase PIF1
MSNYDQKAKNGIELSPDQQRVFDLLKDPRGGSVHIGGGAGHGKSELIRRIDNLFRGQKGYVKVAPNGLAAINVGGRTFMSEFGLNPDLVKQTPREIANLLSRGQVASKYRDLRILLVDEAPTLGGALFDKWFEVLKVLTPGDQWRSIRFIMVGDCLQLGPVEGGPIFESRLWKEIFDNPEEKERTRHRELTTSHRQAEKVFVHALDCMRIGFSVCKSNGIDTYTAERVIKEASMRYEQKDPFSDPLHNVEILKRVATLEAEDKWNQSDESILEPLFSSKRYCCVDLFCRTDNVDVMNLERLKQLPTKEFEYKATDESPIYKGSKGFAQYVRAAEVVCLKIGAVVSLLTNALYNEHGLVNGSLGVVVNFEKRGHLKWPVVRFISDWSKRLIITPAEFEVKSNGTRLFVRTQLPLALCWAMTIHKSQGQTYDSAVVHSKGSFACGHLYTAFSRVRTLDGLSLNSEGEPVQFKSEPRVIEYYKRIGMLDETINSLKARQTEWSDRSKHVYDTVGFWAKCAEHKDVEEPEFRCRECLKMCVPLYNKAKSKEEKKDPEPPSASASAVSSSASASPVVRGNLTVAQLQRIQLNNQRARAILHARALERQIGSSHSTMLTKEQQDRIEANRREALKRKLAAEKVKLQVRDAGIEQPPAKKPRTSASSSASASASDEPMPPVNSTGEPRSSSNRMPMDLGELAHISKAFGIDL